MADRPHYRRAEQASRDKRPPPGPFPTGTRLVVIVVGFVVLVVLAAIAVAIGGDDSGDDGGGDVVAPPGDEDAAVAADLLPAAQAFGEGWVENSRDPEALEAVTDEDDPCPDGPVPEGVLIKASYARLSSQAIVEQLSVTAGVVAAEAEDRIPSLADPDVQECLAGGLGSLVPGAASVEPGALDAPPAPDGAEISVLRLEVEGESDDGGTFDFVLLRRGRAVVLALLAGFDAEAATPLERIVATLDGPLATAAGRLA